ncbi:ribonuclease III [Chlamydiales bacterium]|nr:ribonuclease III [Chlamydiales bacterium]
MNRIEELLSSADEIEEKIGYHFKDRYLLVIAFLHRSFLNENKDADYEHNERLEFLGDSVLGLIISHHLFEMHPEMPEGDLSFLRSRLVEASSCSAYVKKMGVEPYLLLGKGESVNMGRGRDSILSDLFESIIGAIYLDGGIEEATRFLFNILGDQIQEIVETPVSNWKALLQDWSQKRFQVPPVYEILGEIGPDHSKEFDVAVYINEEKKGEGRGPSKKEAQQEAARVAYESISNDQD